MATKKVTNQQGLPNVFIFIFSLLGFSLVLFAGYAAYLAFTNQTGDVAEAGYRRSCIGHERFPYLTDDQFAKLRISNKCTDTLPTDNKTIPQRVPSGVAPTGSSLKQCLGTKLVCLQGAKPIYVNGECQCPPVKLIETTDMQ